MPTNRQGVTRTDPPAQISAELFETSEDRHVPTGREGPTFLRLQCEDGKNRRKGPLSESSGGIPCLRGRGVTKRPVSTR
jgi:hypothetical protein